jgi:hypothetical protein
MNIDVLTHDTPHLLDEPATHPIELRYGTLAAKLLLAGSIPRRRLPCRAHPCLRMGCSAGGQHAARKPCYTLASAPHHSPLGRVQLPNLG